MIVLAILGIIVPLLFGYAISLFFKNTNSLEKIILSASLGIGVLTYIIFLLNQFLGIKLDFTASASLMIIMFLASVFCFVINRKELAKIKARKINFKENLLIKIILVIFILIILYKSLFFPILNGDGFGFHAPIIRGIFSSGWMPTDVGPNTVEFTRAYPPLFYLFGAWLNILNQGFDEVLIQLTPALFGLFILITTYSLAKNLVFKNKKGNRKALLALLLLLMLPMFVNQMVLLNNDTAFAFFALAGVYFVIKYLQTNNPAHLLLGFANLGFSINVKQLGMPFTLSVFIALIFIMLYKLVTNVIQNKKKFKSLLTSQEVKVLVLGILILLIIIAPYFIRNYIKFNDPVYPYLSASLLHLKGKNFVPLLYEPIVEGYNQLNLFYSPESALFSIINFIRDKDYSMSLFFAILVILSLISFKKLSKEQKYLLYFLIFFTIYYAITFLAKYRYYMAAAVMLCIIAAEKFDDILRFRMNKKEKKILLASLLLIILVFFTYFAALLNRDEVINIIGYRAERFLAGIDVLILIQLLVPIIALILFFAVKNIKLKATLVILVLIIPSAYSLLMINYGLTDPVLGQIGKDKDINLFMSQVLKPIPSKEAVLKLHFGNAYDAAIFIKENIPEKAVILTYAEGMAYYFERETIPINSYKFEKTYTTNFTESLRLLKELNIIYIHYKKPGWDEAVFGAGSLFNKSFITKNLNNSTIFKPIYENNEYIIYKIAYP